MEVQRMSTCKDKLLCRLLIKVICLEKDQTHWKEPKTWQVNRYPQGFTSPLITIATISLLRGVHGSLAAPVSCNKRKRAKHRVSGVLRTSKSADYISSHQTHLEARIFCLHASKRQWNTYTWTSCKSDAVPCQQTSRSRRGCKTFWSAGQ